MYESSSTAHLRSHKDVLNARISLAIFICTQERRQQHRQQLIVTAGSCGQSLSDG